MQTNLENLIRAATITALGEAVVVRNKDRDRIYQRIVNLLIQAQDLAAELKYPANSDVLEKFDTFLGKLTT